MSVGATTLGRPKRGTPSRQSAGEDERETVVNMKGSPAYVEWLEAVHRKTHIPKVQIVRLALAEWAEKHGHPSPPEI